MSSRTDTEKRRLVAGGLEISDSVADEAAEWLTLIMSDEATEFDQAELLRWRGAHPDHERAWVHIEDVLGQIKGVNSAVAYKTLSPLTNLDAPDSPGRRKAIHTLLWMGAIGVSAFTASRTSFVKQQVADYRTGTGEQRRIELDDGTVVTLNTATAINVQFGANLRLITLIAGEVMIVTGHKSDDLRPFVVETAEGNIRALGTQFSVYQRDNKTTVAVLDSAVEVSLHPSLSNYQRIQSGEQLTFARTNIGKVSPVTEQASAWMRGQIIADEMSLDDFLQELSRYRPGILRCEPEVAHLRFSGVFPLADTDRILAVLPNVLPVKVSSRSRYWVRVEAALQ